MRKSVVVITAAAGAAVAYAVTKSRAALKEPITTAAEWPPLVPVPTSAEPVTPASTSDGGVPAVNGECPDGYPIKAKKSSSIYHSPGGRNYDRTVPDRCFASAADAEAAGYRAPKS